MKTASYTSLRNALIGRGFEYLFDARDYVFVGPLQVGHKNITVELRLLNREVVLLPAVTICGQSDEIEFGTPNVGPTGVVCYRHPDHSYIDRKNLVSSILGCLEAASRVLIDGRKEGGGQATAEEFHAYWAGRPMLADPTGVLAGRGRVELCRISLRDSPSTFVVSKNRLGLYKDKIASPSVTITTHIAEVDSGAVACTGNWPPESFRDVKEWLEKTHGALLPTLQEAVKSILISKGPVIFWVRTPINEFALLLSIRSLESSLYSRNPQAFARRIMRGRAASRSVCVTRYTPYRIDPEHVVERNIDTDKRSLAGLRITIIGCGAVGGYLASKVARLGAGVGGGRLQLIDPSLLKTGNIGRHILGFDHLFSNKAKACVESLRAELPGVELRSVEARAETIFESYAGDDLIVDATGHDGFSMWLNEKKVDGACAPIVYSWIYGNGAAGAAFLQSEASPACFACLRTSEAGHGLSPLKTDYEPQLRFGPSCDSLYVPFPVTAVDYATAVASQLIMDWVNGHPKPTFRVALVDPKDKAVKQVGSTTPTVWRNCAICQ